jgi:hypothetical protein
MKILKPFVEIFVTYKNVTCEVATSALKMETVCFSETLVSIYESTRRNNPEQQHRHTITRNHDRTKVFHTAAL